MTETPCSINPDMWYSEGPRSIQAAKSICSTCPLQEACLEQAIKNREVFGVWGGINFEDPKERPSYGIKLCRGKKHELPLDHKGECKLCRKDAKKKYDATRPKRVNWKNKPRQKQGDICKNGHLLDEDNILIRTYDKAVTCKKCNTNIFERGKKNKMIVLKEAYMRRVS